MLYLYPSSLPNTYANGYSYGHIHSDSYCDCYCDCYANSDSYRDFYGYANIDAYGYFHRNRDTYTAAYSVTKGWSATKASADSRAAIACWR